MTLEQLQVVAQVAQREKSCRNEAGWKREHSRSAVAWAEEVTPEVVLQLIWMLQEGE